MLGKRVYSPGAYAALWSLALLLLICPLPIWTEWRDYGWEMVGYHSSMWRAAETFPHIAHVKGISIRLLDMYLDDVVFASGALLLGVATGVVHWTIRARRLVLVRKD